MCVCVCVFSFSFLFSFFQFLVCTFKSFDIKVDVQKGALRLKFFFPIINVLVSSNTRFHQLLLYV